MASSIEGQYKDDRFAGKSREEIRDMFSGRTKRWKCPNCGMDLTGRTYNLDASRPKCSKTWHTHSPVSCEYVRLDQVMPELMGAVENGKQAAEVQAALDARKKEVGIG